MVWEPSDVIAAAAILSSAGIAVATLRWQRATAAADRRREVHLRMWQAANHALRTQQAWFSSMQQPRVDRDGSETEEIGAALRELTEAHVEMEIVSPRLAKECVPLLTALELSRLDLRTLAGIRREMTTGASTGGEFGRARVTAHSDLEAARVALNRVQRIMRRSERTGALA